MIATEIYNGQGLGNQLWCYVFTRCLSEKLGTKFSIINPEKFKCTSFLNLDYGEYIKNDGLTPEGGPALKLPSELKYYFKEHKKFHHKSGADITYFDPKSLEVLDFTKIDGNFQSEEFILPYREKITSWLIVDEKINCVEYSNDETCIINFRGGEYKGRKDLYLEKEYWDNALSHMRTINPDFRFIVITDDVAEASNFFPDLEVLHFSVGKDYSIINNAHYLILSNSSFAFFPAWTSKKLKYCLAPKYWAAYNDSSGYWSCEYNVVLSWHYIDKSCKVLTGGECISEQHIEKRNDTLYLDKKPADTFLIETKRLLHFSVKKINFVLKKISSRISVYIYNKLGAYDTSLDIIFNRKLKLYNSIGRTKKEDIKVYDCFLFFNELDLLEIRLNMLNEYVDYFIIAESTVTFTGKSKQLFYYENRSRFEKFHNKIIHYVIDDTPDSYEDLIKKQYIEINRLKKEIIATTLNTDNFEKSESHWLREFYQKECIKIPICDIKENDICIISDVDEIWNPDEFAVPVRDELLIYKQKAFYYYLNNYANDFWWTGWNGSVSFRAENLINGSINHIRTHHKNNYLVVKNGGWHFTFQGGKDKIITKLESYGHQEFNTKNIKDNILNSSILNKDYRGRSLKFKITSEYLPTYVSQNSSLYEHMLIK